MANYITTLKDEDKTNNLLPRTVLKAVADDNGNYLDSGLAASDVNALKNGKVADMDNRIAQNTSAISGIMKLITLDLTTDSDGYASYNFGRNIRIISVFLRGRNGSNVNGWMVGFSRFTGDSEYRYYYFPVFSNEGSRFGSHDITIDVLYQDIV